MFVVRRGFRVILCFNGGLDLSRKGVMRREARTQRRGGYNNLYHSRLRKDQVPPSVKKRGKKKKKGAPNDIGLRKSSRLNSLPSARTTSSGLSGDADIGGTRSSNDLEKRKEGPGGRCFVWRTICEVLKKGVKKEKPNCRNRKRNLLTKGLWVS